jgi:hypothetical protein
MYRSHAGIYGPSKSSSLASTDAGLLSLLLHWLGWEINRGGSYRSLSRAKRWSQEHFFLTGGSIRPTLLTTYERLPCMGTVRRKRTSNVH